jgi:hypothetical protein
MAYPSTFADLQSAVLNKGKLDDVLDVQRIKDWINQTYMQVCVETEFYGVSAVASVLTQNQTVVTVPATINKVDFIVPTGSDGSSWGPMEMVTMEEILRQRAYSGGVTMTTGAPSKYCYSSPSSIQIWPNPSGSEVLTFYGTGLPTALISGTDPPVIPEPYASKLLEYGALVNAAEFKRDMEMLTIWQGMYMDWLSRFRGFTNTRVGDKVQSFTVVGSSAWPRGNSTDVGF